LRYTWLRFDDFALQPKPLQETFSPVSWLNDALATTRNDAESSTAAPAHGDRSLFSETRARPACLDRTFYACIIRLVRMPDWPVTWL